MYGQGNFGSQLQQGPHTVVPPFQHRPPGTFPPPPTPLQQGPPAPAHPIMPEASSAIRPQVGQLGPPLYQHTPPHQHTLVQQGPQVHGGMQSVGQSYLHPPPPTHVSVPLRQSYPSAQQSSQYPAHLGTQNMHHIPPRVLSTLGPPGSEIFLAPPPPRIPPPPPSPLQGQTLYRTLMPPVPGVVQGLHHGPLPPPPPPSTSSYFTPATYGSFVHSAPEGNTLSTAPPPPPPLPPSPPPLPPSPPPSASPLHGSRTSSTPILAVDFPSSPSSKKLSGSDLNASDSFDKVPAGNHMGDNMTISDGYRNRESGSDSVVGSIIKDGSTNESVVRKIDILCKSIAVNGPGFEDMACQKEYQSPGANDTRDIPLRPSEIESSIQPDGAKDAGGSLSLADSDMDMEDDIVQFDKEDAVHHSHEGPNPKSMMIHDGYDEKEQLAASKCPPLHNLFRNASPNNGSASVTSGLAEKVISSAQAAQRPSDKNLEISSTAGPGGSSPSNPLAGSAGTVYGKDAGKLSMSGSPFRLLQDYASEESSENNEHCRKDDSPLKSSPSVSVGNTSLNRDVRDCLEADVGSKSSCGSEELQSLSQAIVASFPSMPIKPPYSPMESQMEVGKTIIRSVVAVQVDEQVDAKCKSQEFRHSATQDAFQEHNAVEGGNSVVVPERCKSVKEKCVSTEVKVDEFGRLVREGLSDSDSEDFHYTQRHGKRGRSRSRSLSPNGRRKRRSSLRRRERRSRSRSWSPRRRRSKSRSPVNRHVGELGGKRMRQSRGRIPDCLDFLRGKCQRGASCRFLHNESDQSGGSRRKKSKFHSPEVPPNSQDTEIQEMQVSQDLHGSGFSAQRDQIGSDKSKVGSRSDFPRSIYSDQDVKLLETDLDESGRLRGAHAQVQETHYVQEEPTNTHPYNNDNYHKSEETGQALLADRYSSKSVTEICTLKLPGDAAELATCSALNTAFQQSQTSHSVPVLQNADHQPVSFISDISPDQTVKSSPDNPPVSVPLLDDIATTHSYTSLDSHSHPSSSDNPSYQLLPPPPPLPLPQGTNAPHIPQLPKDYNLIQPTVNLPFQSAPEESIPAYQAPLPGQHTHFSLPPNSTWTSLPPPPRPAFMNHLTVNGVTTIPGFPPKFLQNHLSQTSIRPHPTDLPNPSQVGDFQHQAYLPMPEHYQPALHLEDYGSKHPPAVNSLAQPFAGPNLVRKDFSLGSYSHDNVHAESMPFLRESPTTKMQSFPGDDVPAAEHHKPSSQNHPYLRQQVPPYGLQHPAADNASVSLALRGSSNSSTSKIPSDILERNQLPRLSDFVGSRVAAHYNPYASTFDQPLSSKFSSTAFRLEKDASHGYRYDAALSSSHLPIDGQGVGSIGLRQISSSPKSARAIEKILPRTGGDQYDPLFDSIEPTSNSIRKYDNVQKHVLTGDSDITLRFSASHKPLDVEENNKKKEEGAVAADTSLENDEYGETADAEVGAVENGSPSDPIDDVNTAPGEVEIDQIKSPGKSRRSKDSRSMKLFKVALADFVKEVLKPSWRQGNMSKEAFKTIVKKTVDKVSGAMKGHQIPKSQAKINHYIDSSQRKLTKLVMGYVDKYVKM